MSPHRSGHPWLARADVCAIDLRQQELSGLGVNGHSMRDLVAVLISQAMQEATGPPREGLKKRSRNMLGERSDGSIAEARGQPMDRIP